MLRFDIITIFPEVFDPVLRVSILKRACEQKKIDVRVHDLRDYTLDKHRKVDDRPFGGGPGMVLQPEPIFRAVKKIKGKRRARVLLMSPSGKPFTQRVAKKISQEKNVIIICGHYEGVDDRVQRFLVDDSYSIGDYVLTGGEIPAMVIVDGVSRLVPGVLGKKESLECESFEQGKLEHPQYTRPANFRGMKVPDVLLSGNHQSIQNWRMVQSKRRTKSVRPDLIK